MCLFLRIIKKNCQKCHKKLQIDKKNMQVYRKTYFLRYIWHRRRLNFFNGNFYIFLYFLFLKYDQNIKLQKKTTNLEKHKKLNFTGKNVISLYIFGASPVGKCKFFVRQIKDRKT